MAEIDNTKRCFDCAHCGMDMDMDPYCAHPQVTVTAPHGISVNRVRGTPAPDDAKNYGHPEVIGKCGPDGKLFEQREQHGRKI